MLSDKMKNILSTDAEVLVAGDYSCMMSIAGGLQRIRSGIRAMHLAEVLAGTKDQPWNAPATTTKVGNLMIDSIEKLADKLNLNPATWQESSKEENELGWSPGHPIPEDPLREAPLPRRRQEDTSQDADAKESRVRHNQDSDQAQYSRG